MPFWPFKRRRRSAVKNTEEPQPLSEKTHSAAAQSTPSVPRKSSKWGSLRKRPASQEGRPPEDMRTKQKQPMSEKEKENRPPPPVKRRTSIEDDITALPVSRQLTSSPHLRPVDTERPHIPYSFRQHSASQSSLQRQQAVVSPGRPKTLKSQRSGHESITPQRKRSRKEKRKDEHLREEEIRAMSAPIPIPKRPGDGPLRRDSKKLRPAGAKESVVSLPHGESIHSTMSGIEQRGWEIGGFDVFNPRPAVRLSGTPQYIAPSSMPTSPHVPSDRQKKPETRDSAKSKKRETIGNTADDFDASDLRLLLERDAKRRERRKKVQQEKLDEKLRKRAGRNRGDSDKRRHEREAEEELRAEDARRRAEQEATERRLTTPPEAIHPALRDQPVVPEAAAVAAGARQVEAGATEPKEGTEQAQQLEAPENPFTDDAQQVPTPKSEQLPVIPGAFETIDETPAASPTIGTPRDVRMSQTSTPPLSPTESGRGTPSISQVIDSRRASDLPPPKPITDDRRASEPKADRRPGTWGAFFRRGGTFARRQNAGNASPSEFQSSFSNTSRESMRNQPLPAHLVDTSMPIAKPRSKSGTPVRTQSKFREDLPELPISPPDSRMPSPDVASAAIAAAAAREAGKTEPVDIPRGRVPDSGSARNDTPMSPVRGHDLMSASLASIGSEGSWLASGGSAKRRSTQSALSRDMGSLNRQKEFNASYEELGVDKDAEYISRNTLSPTSKRLLRGQSMSGPAMSGASPDEESELDFDATRPETPGEPLTVHQSVRRKPTLVTRDPRVRSREGLLTEYTAEIENAEPAETAAPETSDPSPVDLSDAEPEVRSASSVNYGKEGRGHARQVSAGSARLLDVKRSSTAPTSAPGSPTRG